MAESHVVDSVEDVGAYMGDAAGPAERSVFRPFHATLATHLRGEPSTEQIMADPIVAATWQQRREQAHAAIFEAMLSTVSKDPAGQRDWLTAHPYLRTYVAQHAATAGPQAFPQLVGDLGYLATADRLTLTPELTSRALLTSAPGLHDIARVYRRARPLPGANLRANAAYLREASHALTDPPAVPDGSCVLPLYTTLMASVRPDQSKSTLTGHAKKANAVAFGRTRNGDLLLTAASDDGAQGA
ncbi:hypothetical protein [Streptomyces sp. NPDC058579]|uniref:hypothetical protein n=1 Tax=Streptomyces sp. NPDC058579 TaxID=3346548 RepID=UPI00364630F3